MRTRLIKTGRREQRLAERRAAEPQLADRRPLERQPRAREPAERQPVEQQPAEQQPVEQQPVEQQPAEQQPAEVRVAFRRSPTSQRAMGDLDLLSEKSLRLGPETRSLFFGLSMPILAKRGVGIPSWFGGTAPPIRLIFGQATSLV